MHQLIFPLFPKKIVSIIKRINNFPFKLYFNYCLLRLAMVLSHNQQKNN